MLTAVYAVPGAGQGDDMRAYFDYLCAVDGFVRFDASNNVSAFDATVGSSIQVQRNSVEADYLIVVQADYDAEGYTITIMRGEGQASGAGGQTGGSNTGGSGGDGSDLGGSGTNDDSGDGGYASLDSSYSHTYSDSNGFVQSNDSLDMPYGWNEVNSVGTMLPD
jgi:hypothetical protein